MELQDFVKESLTQILMGVKEAQTSLACMNAHGSIAPEIRNNWAAMEARGVLLTQQGVPVQTVEFDVSVTATEGTGTKGGIKIVIGVLGLGSQGQSSQSSANTSRLKFTVPISLPVQNVQGT